jgi:cbb3-type cytochrome oxidase subunit 3
MDASTCPWLTKANSYSQHLTVEYDCILLNNTRKTQLNENVVLFTAKVNIESPPELFNDSNLLDENEWKEYFFKKYFHDKQLNEEKTIVIEQQRSLFSDILRTIIILLIFAFILIILMLISLLIYKRIHTIKKRKLYDQEKHQPFPADDAYDNLKTTTIETASDSGTTTDV